MGTILENTAYEMSMAVTCYDVDRYNRLKISALMKLHQEVGERHITAFGITSEELRNIYDIAFIFTRVRIKIHRLPKAEERITVRTWCSELKGVRFMRNYQLISENGEMLTESKGEVAAIKLSDRSIVRPRDQEAFNCFLYNFDLDNSCEKPSKLSVLHDGGSWFKRPVRFSDLDYNGHMNNTVYADVVFDHLPKEALQKPVTEFQINFLNEALVGETVLVGVNQTESGYEVSGCVGEKHCFSSKVSY